MSAAWFRVLLFLFVGGLLGISKTAAQAPEKSSIDFNRDIRPILSDKCYSCHGPDEGHREAELRLDLAEEAVADRGGTQAIFPGDAQQSEVWLRITSDDPDELMPPAESHKSLTPEEIELLRRWIDEGAEWQGHWAFASPTQTAMPRTDDVASNPIDHFVRQAVAEQGLASVLQADRRTLVRRLAFDLTGLPPEMSEVEAFLDSTESGAYEQVVERFLASPHFGEKLALFWLDLVRFADTCGIHGDQPRQHTPYRDYVIQAFNDNMPFDQFTIEQLAGDLLPNSTNSQKIASGYNRLNMTTEEGGAQPKEYIAKYAADRVRNVSSVWLGVTMGCCECHDHKFDPFTTREFYEMSAFFADLEETPVGVQRHIALPVGEAAQQRDELQKQLQVKLQERPAEYETALAEWEQVFNTAQTRWTTLHPDSASAASGTTLQRLEDDAISATNLPAPQTDVFTVELKSSLARITAIRLEVLPDAELPNGGPGRHPNGNFVLNELEVHVDDKLIKLHGAVADYSQEGWAVAGAIDGNPTTGWASQGHLGKSNQAVFRTSITRNEGDQEITLSVRLDQNHGSSHTLGHFRLSATDAADPTQTNDERGLTSLEMAAALKVEHNERTEPQNKLIAEKFRNVSPLFVEVRKDADELGRQIQEIDKRAKILVAMTIAPREVRILPKGSWLDDSGEVVLPGTPSCLSPLEVSNRRATRLDLARWIVRPDHPLTARVLVNRLWKMMFGRGLVTSLDDFGAQGTWPSHPELLDWLATELVDSGWDIKHLLRLIVTSETYRLSSTAGEQLQASDPGNQWLARQGKFRLDAELVRDNALAVSGLLDPKIGGMSVKPYQPTGYWQHLNFPRRVYQQDAGTSLYRRGLYTHWQRTFLNPSLMAFDAPSREECTAKRSRSNTPQQALVLLNDPTYVEAARALAARMIETGKGDARQTVDVGYRRVLARSATDEETAILLRLYQQHHQQYQADPTSASALLEIGERPIAEDCDLVELAAWTSVARVLLNLHETITRY